MFVANCPFSHCEVAAATEAISILRASAEIASSLAPLVPRNDDPGSEDTHNFDAHPIAATLLTEKCVAYTLWFGFATTSVLFSKGEK